MDNKQENNKTRGPLARRDFLRVVGSVVAGGSVLATTIALARRAGAAEGSYYWQIDPAKCTQCGRCETDCVLNVSAVKCFHANRVRPSNVSMPTACAVTAIYVAVITAPT